MRPAPGRRMRPGGAARPLLDFPHAFGDGFARQAAGAAHLRDAAIPKVRASLAAMRRRVRSSKSAQTEANFCSELGGGSHLPE